MRCACKTSPSPWEKTKDGWECKRCCQKVYDDLGEVELGNTADALIAKLLRRGHQQGHGAKVWLTEPIENHLLKSARHSLTSQLMLAGLSPSPDAAGEGIEAHLERAAVRALMALAVHQRNQIHETLERR